MIKPSMLAFKIILVSLSSAYLMSCTGGAASSSFGSSSSTNVDSGPDGSSDGITDPMKFYVGIDSAINDIAHVHKEGLFGNACSIDPTSSLQDFKCIVDSPEAEIYMHGLSLKYNVPPGMCRYLARETYWFYNHEVGYGPSSIRVDLTVTDGNVTGSSCYFDGVGPAACSSNIEALVNVSSASPVIKCIYDHTDSEFGKNGCLGSYTLTLNTTTVTTNPAPAPPTVSNSTSVSVVPWGGSVGPLIGGAGRHGWDLSANGYPVRVYNQAHLGIFNELYSVGAPIDVSGPTPYLGSTLRQHTNMEIANYSTPALNTHSGYTSGAVSTLPYAIEPIDDFSGDFIGSGNEPYLFECVDQAHEILHRVRLYVREWDTYQDYYDYIVSKGSVEIPDRRVGSEGGTCTGVQGPCNDYSDFDDLASFWVSYSTTVPLNNSTDPNLTRRRYYFPQVSDK